MGQRPSHTEHSHTERRELIAWSHRGEVRRCSDCRALHLRFGNAPLALNPDDLEPLRQAVESTLRRQKTSGHGSAARSVEIFLGESGVGFAFDVGELAELDALLDMTSRRVARPVDAFTGDAPNADVLHDITIALPPAIVNQLRGISNARS